MWEGQCRQHSWTWRHPILVDCISGFRHPTTLQFEEALYPTWVSPASSQSVPVNAPPAAIPHVPPPGASLLMLPRRASPLRFPRRKDHGSLLGTFRKGSWLSRLHLSYEATAYPLRRLVRLSSNTLCPLKLSVSPSRMGIITPLPSSHGFLVKCSACCFVYLPAYMQMQWERQ